MLFHSFDCVQSSWGDVPASYELVSQRKGFKRYKSPQLSELLAEYAAAQEQREAALSGVLQVNLLSIKGSTPHAIPCCNLAVHGSSAGRLIDGPWRCGSRTSQGWLGSLAQVEAASVGCSNPLTIRNLLTQGVVRQFAKSHTVWEAAVDAVAELDALMSLAAVADFGSIYGPMCRPRLIEASSSQQVGRPFLNVGVVSKVCIVA